MIQIAVCVLIERDGALLGVSNKDNASVFGLPGGKCLPNELPKEAAVRKLIEETGLKVPVSSLTFLYKGTEPISGREVITFSAPDLGYEASPGPTKSTCIWIGWPTLLKGSYASYNANVRLALQESTPLHWVKTHGSGTLLRAIEEGLLWNEMYLSERTAFVFGYRFQCVLSSRLTAGEALAECDNKAITETNWWTRVLRWRAVEAGKENVYQVRHITLSDGDGTTTSGLGIILDPLPRPNWLPANRKLIAFTTDEHGKTVNPC